jgi:hypothetical protein
MKALVGRHGGGFDKEQEPRRALIARRLGQLAFNRARESRLERLAQILALRRGIPA